MFVSLPKYAHAGTGFKMMKMFPDLFLFWQEFKAQMEGGTSFSGKLTGLFGFQ